MDPLTKGAAGGFLGLLTLLGLGGGALAWAQDTALAGVATVNAAGGSYTVDLGNITLPGAVVICVGMILRAEKLPSFRVRVSHYHYEVEEPTDALVRVRRKGNDEDD